MDVGYVWGNIIYLGDRVRWGCLGRAWSAALMIVLGHIYVRDDRIVVSGYGDIIVDMNFFL